MLKKSYLFISSVLVSISPCLVNACDLDMKVFQDSQNLYITIVNSSDEPQTVNSRMSIGNERVNELSFAITDGERKPYIYCCKQRIFPAQKHHFSKLNPSSLIGRQVSFQRLKYLYGLDGNKKYSLVASYNTGTEDTCTLTSSTSFLIP